MMVVVALVAGSLLAWNPALRADETNTPPASPPPAGPTAGQHPPGTGMRPPIGGPNLDIIAKQLNLTDDQKAKVGAILQTQNQKMRDVRSDASLSPEERRPKMQSIREETTAQMKTILNPEQFEKWQTAQRNRRPGGPGGPPPGSAGAGGTNAPAAPPTK